MSKSKLNKSWERDDGKSHSPQGVKELREAVRSALYKKYTIMAQAMWSYDLEPKERFEDMVIMSEGLEPERILCRNGEGDWFEMNGQLLFLPSVMTDGVNIYGKPVARHPVPVGWYDGKEVNSEVSRMMQIDLIPGQNSVHMKNDRFGQGDLEIIRRSVDALVDVYLTINQLVLLARSPLIFRVTSDTYLTAKNLFKKIAECEPVAYTDRDYGEDGRPLTETVSTPIDPSLFDVFDKFESILLDSLGIESLQTHKRAQMNIVESTQSDDKAQLIRASKLAERQRAVGQLNDLFGCSVKVHSVIDEMNAQQDEDMQSDMDRSQSMEGNGNGAQSKVVG